MYSPENTTFTTFELEIGLIPTQYKTTTYFNQIYQGALGLMPTYQNEILSRQFMYTMQNQFNLDAESFAVMSPTHVMMIGGTAEQIESYQPRFSLGQTTKLPVPLYNATASSEPTGAHFQDGHMYIRLESHTLPVRPSSNDQYVVVDSYYRQLHMPEAYFKRLTDTIAIPDFTCNLVNTSSYFETVDGEDYLCYCNGNSYNGLPSFTITYYDLNIEFEMSASQYLFDPYLNYTSRTTSCVLSLAGPANIDYFDTQDHVLILG